MRYNLYLKRFLCVISFILYSTVAFTQWDYKWINPLPQGITLNSIYFIDDNIGFAVGRDGIILKTNDGGNIWSDISYINPSVQDTAHYSIYFINSNVGFIVGEYGKILKTINGGISWTVQLSNVTNNLTSVYFINNKIGFITVQDGGYILKTIDGGTNWVSISADNFNDVCFADSLTGFAVGFSGRMMKTTDGGKTWSTPSYKFTNSTLYSICFPDNTTGYIVGENGSIYKTTDKGVNWNWVGIGGINTNTLLSVSFLDAKTGYVCGNNGKLISTYDGGNTWIDNSFSTNNQAFNSVFVTSGNTAYACGTDGILVKKNKNGLWNMLSSGTTVDLGRIIFTNNNIGYITSRGEILKTINGGQNWSSILFGNSSNYSSMYFINSDTGFVSNNNIILKTIDGGINWHEVHQSNIVTNIPFYFSMCFINSNIGYVVGPLGSIFKTLNCGESWSAVNSPTNNHLFSIYFIDSITGFLAGDSGTFYKTVNGGDNWSLISLSTTNALSKIFFINKNTGFLKEGHAIYKTTNSGFTWNKIWSNVNDNIIDLYFIDSNVGFMLYGDNNFFKTTDGGLNWYKIIQPRAWWCSSIYFNNEKHGLTVGAFGTILELKTNWNNLVIKTNTELSSIYQGTETEIAVKIIDGNSPYKYAWNTGSKDSLIVVSPNQTSTYFVTVTDASSQIATEKVVITVNKLPYIIFENDTLFVNPIDNSKGIKWVNGTAVLTHAWNGINGKTNTDSIIKYQGNDYYAANLCYTLDTLGFNDWYLPSVRQLQYIYLNRNTIGGFDNFFYWSSTEDGSYNGYGSAYCYLFKEGNEYIKPKSDGCNVRCIRDNKSMNNGIKNSSSNNDISFYPNPVSNNIYFSNNNNIIYNIEIINIMGQTVLFKQINIDNPKKQIDVSELINGIYFVKVQNEKGSIIKKIIKQ